MSDSHSCLRLDSRHGITAPPFVQLRELEAASLALERDEDNMAPAGGDWMRMLIAPGGLLGGTRPKASVVDRQGQLRIAKFPGVRDEHDMGRGNCWYRHWRAVADCTCLLANSRLRLRPSQGMIKSYCIEGILSSE